MQQRRPLDYLLIGLKGIAMGAADVVPGVSGGTIAIISGIYEELLDSINSFNKHSLQLLYQKKWVAFWEAINGNFLLALFAGIGLSLLSLAKLMTYLLNNHALLLWAFFFGLVLASVYFVGKEVNKWNWRALVLFVVGACIAFFISQLPPMANSDSMWFLFVSGILAVCAMILPGISGAFILVLLGSYSTVLQAVDQRNILVIAVVGFGAIIGLVSFSRLLKYLFHHFKYAILALLTGFIFGSLPKIWPWKKTITTFIDRHGAEKPLHQIAISPNKFEGDPQMVMVILLAIVGFSIIFVLEFVAKQLKQ